MKTELIEKAYAIARERYAEIGVDTEKVKTMQPLSDGDWHFSLIIQTGQQILQSLNRTCQRRT